MPLEGKLRPGCVLAEGLAPSFCAFAPVERVIRGGVQFSRRSRPGLAARGPDDSEEVLTLRRKLEVALLAWLEETDVNWCDIREDRPEILVRRDIDTPVSWFGGKKVVIWGCGALGGHIAEYLARAGVGELLLYDWGRVVPGVLARQPYDDDNIGAPKAKALRERLLRIRPKMTVEVRCRCVLQDCLEREDWDEGADLVVDATASQRVLVKAEAALGRFPKHAPVLAMLARARAERGLAILVGSQYSGGVLDAARKTKLRLTSVSSRRSVPGGLLPAEGRKVFQPEPGCSDATFVGSDADVSALAGAVECGRDRRGTWLFRAPTFVPCRMPVLPYIVFHLLFRGSGDPTAE